MSFKNIQVKKENKYMAFEWNYQTVHTLVSI